MIPLVFDLQLFLYSTLLFVSASGEFPDFLQVDEALNFDPFLEQFVQCVTIDIIDDSVLEAEETFNVMVTTSDPDISIRPFNSATVTIRNDDGMTLR